MMHQKLLEERLRFLDHQIRHCNDDPDKLMLLKQSRKELRIILGEIADGDEWTEWRQDNYYKNLSLETHPHKIRKKLLQEFGQNNSWYAQFIGILLYITEGKMIVCPADQQDAYAFDHAIRMLKEGRELFRKQERGDYHCYGCLNERNKYLHGYNQDGDKLYCDECAKEKFGKEEEE